MITEFKINKEEILSEDSRFNILTDIYLSLRSDKSSLYSDFAFIVRIYKGTLLKIAEWKLVPNYSGRLITNITPILKNVVPILPFVTETDRYIALTSQSIRIVVKEYYDNEEQGSATKDIYLYNLRARTIDDERVFTKYSIENYTSPFLTKIGNNNVLTLANPQLISVRSGIITVYIYLSNGSIYSYNYSISDMYVILNLKSIIEEYFTLQQIKNTVKVVVEAQTDYQTKRITYNYNYFDCQNLVTIMFENEFGVWETFNFRHREHSYEFSEQKYLRKEHLYEPNTYVKGGMQKTAVRNTEKLHLWSDFVDEDTAKWLYSNLSTSKRVYIAETDANNEYIYTPIYVEPQSMRIESSEYSDGQVVSLTAITNVYDNV